MLTLLISLACLGCGAGGDSADAKDAPVSLPAAAKTMYPPASSIIVGTGPESISAPPEPARAAASASARASAPAPDTALAPGAITSVVLENTGTSGQAGALFSFGQVFAAGDLGRKDTVKGKLSDGSAVALQVDVKARHADGSVRHAVISALAPALAPGQQRRLELVRTAATPPALPSTPSALLERGFSASVSLTLGTQVYRAAAHDLLRSGKYSTWLAGPLANEWLVWSPLLAANGTAHPHLTARFAVRAAAGQQRARVDVTIENTWAFEASPQNFVYDAEVTVGGKSVYTRAKMTHYHHARWRKVFWWGPAPALHISHDSAYLIASRALPNYDRSVVIPESVLAAYKALWSGEKIEPMGIGLAKSYMAATGGRPDIGLLPGWSASYLLSMDKRAKEVMLGTADLAGSWSAHYRDKTTGRPVSVRDFPYMTILGRSEDTLNPKTGRRESFPPCAAGAACDSPYKHDSSHQPAFAYLPYLVTGDHYYLEELQFWSMWNTLSQNPGYREHAKGLYKAGQVRAQAWSMRTLAEAAYATPDADPLKQHFEALLLANLQWYNAMYSRNPTANELGVLTNGIAVQYEKHTAVAPWQDDFFTAAIGHAYDLGFHEAKPLLQWKVKFPIARMSAPGACWIHGASYWIKIRDASTGPIYGIGQAWLAAPKASQAEAACGSAGMAAALRLAPGEMVGYSKSAVGFPSNMQPALAYAADTAGAPGRQAWGIFAGRSVKPDYGLGPQFAIVPRSPAPPAKTR